VEKLTAESVNWALENKVSVMLDGVLVPLAIGEPELLERFEALNSECTKNAFAADQLVHIASPA
jgi:hypothetical protein